MKALVTCLALWFTAFLACASGEKVCLIKINGAIGPATASYISRSIGEAQSQNAQCLIIQLNAAGGKVFVEGEYWNAVSDTPVEQGKPVEVSAVLGLTLKVRPKT